MTALGRPLTRGDVVLARFPFTDLTSAKRRPIVVLWADPAQVDFTCAFISSQLSASPSVGEVTLLAVHPEFVLSGLSAPSRILTAKVATLHRSLLTRWLGRLGPLLTADLDRALVTALGINTVPYREEGRQDERRRLIAIYGAGGPAALLSDLGVTAP